MIDSLTGSSIVIATKLDGGEQHLTKLSPSDFVAIANYLGTERRNSIIQNAGAAQLAPQELFRILNDFDARPVTLGDIIDAAKRSDIQRDVLLRALRRSDADADEAELDAMNLDLSDIFRLVLQLLHVKLEPVKNGQAGERPLPDAPEEPASP